MADEVQDVDAPLRRAGAAAAPASPAAATRPRREARLDEVAEGVAQVRASPRRRRPAATPCGCASDDQDAQAPRAAARARSAGTAVNTLRTKLTEEVARNSRREGSKASSQGLSATQSSICLTPQRTWWRRTSNGSLR